MSFYFKDKTKDEIKKVTELLGRTILGKKMSQRKKSRTNFRYFVF